MKHQKSVEPSHSQKYKTYSLCKRIMVFVKNKRSRSLYVSAVQMFVATQIQYCDLLQSFYDEWIENGGTEGQSNLIQNASEYFRVLKRFCEEANENLKVVKATDDTSVTKIRVCTLFNVNVTCNRKFKNAVSYLTAQDESWRMGSPNLGSAIENRLVDLTMKSLLRLRKNLARINQVLVDANKFEAHESTLALIKLNRLLDTLLPQQDEPSSYNAVANAFEVPVDRVYDTSLVSQNAWSINSPDGVRAAFIAFQAIQHQVTRLKSAIGHIHSAVEHVVGENLRFAEMWYELLGHNAYEYAVRSFLDQCRSQHRKTQETQDKLVDLQNVLSDAHIALDQVLGLVRAGTAVMKEFQRKSGRNAMESHRQRILQVISTGHNQTVELVAVVIRVLIAVMHEWLGSLVSGRDPGGFSEKVLQGHRDIVVEYYRCIMFTDALCLSYQKTKVKLFNESPAP